MPNIGEFNPLLRKHVHADMEFEHDTEFIAKQLLEITKLLDFSDEAGRRNLIALLGKRDNCPIFINQYIQIQFLLFQSLGLLHLI